MAEIRGPSAGLPAPGAAVARPANPARTAAQRAFFEAALGVQPTPAPAAPQRAAPQPVAPSLAQGAVSAEQPQRYLRPGSIIDIKV